MHWLAGLVENRQFHEVEVAAEPARPDNGAHACVFKVESRDRKRNVWLYVRLRLSREFQAVLRYVFVYGPFEVFQRLVAFGKVLRQIIG